jgi:hypothetical protein
MWPIELAVAGFVVEKLNILLHNCLNLQVVISGLWDRPITALPGEQLAEVLLCSMVTAISSAAGGHHAMVACQARGCLQWALSDDRAELYANSSCCSQSLNLTKKQP